MTTIAIVSQKGGSGKTTLAVHLAAEAIASGREAVVIDTDPQATAAAWGDWRHGAEPEVVTAPAARLARVVDNAKGLGAEVIVIDTPPSADAAAREAVTLADLILIPARPAGFDLHAIQTTAALVQGRRSAFVVFNAAPIRGYRICADAGELVAKLGLLVCPVIVSERASFRHATTEGRVAGEVEPEGKAAAEAAALWRWACQQVPARIAT